MNNLKKIICAAALCLLAVGTVNSQTIPDKQSVLNTTELVNDYFMSVWPDPTKPTFVRNKVRPSSLWTRAVYYEGLMALYNIDRKVRYFNYAMNWANFHKWTPRNGVQTKDADDYCCGQTYIDLYNFTGARDNKMIAPTRQCMDNLLATDRVSDWWWIDAIQMGLPVLGKLGSTLGDTRYFEKGWQMYEWERNHNDGGMWNAKEGLWWRDQNFNPPYKEPNGRNCYWSRGNGWVYAALVRIMDEINKTPGYKAHYKEYKKDFIAMSKALIKCQRPDGFWNCSLHDESNFGGKETSGTALFVYGMAWGVRMGYLKKSVYLPVLAKAWNAMVSDAVHQNGFLGYVQGTGKEPKDGQPTTYDNVPDFDDYGVGCFLLAGTEVYKLSEIQK